MRAHQLSLETGKHYDTHEQQQQIPIRHISFRFYCGHNTAFKVHVRFMCSDFRLLTTPPLPLAALTTTNHYTHPSVHRSPLNIQRFTFNVRIYRYLVTLRQCRCSKVIGKHKFRSFRKWNSQTKSAVKRQSKSADYNNVNEVYVTTVVCCFSWLSQTNFNKLCSPFDPWASWEVRHGCCRPAK